MTKFALCEALLLLMLPCTVMASGADLVVVMIDEKTEEALGDFPYDRARLAEGIDAARQQGAKAVILKFFLDRPKTGEGDGALAEAMGKIPVVLQARFDEHEKHTNPLPEHCYWNAAGATPSLSGNKGWIPLPLFSEHAACIGFIDSIDPAPALEYYRDKPVKSLFTCSLQLFDSEMADAVADSKLLRIGDRQWLLSEEGNFIITWPTRTEPLPAISFVDLIRHDIEPAALKNKVVLFGYDGKKMRKIDSPVGETSAHRLFYYVLTLLLSTAEQNANNISEESRENNPTMMPPG